MAPRNTANMLMAARTLMEGAPPDLELISLLTGRSVAYLERVARQEGWRMAGAGTAGDGALDKRLAALTQAMVEETEKLAFEALGGRYDKQRVDALGTLLKIAERLEGIVRSSKYSAQQEKEDDEELATALALVDARIVELACELAATLGGETCICQDRSEGDA